jgi:hypothetical protein
MNFRNVFGMFFLLVAFVTGNVACQLPLPVSYVVTVTGTSGVMHTPGGCTRTQADGAVCANRSTTFVLRVNP